MKFIKLTGHSVWGYSNMPPLYVGVGNITTIEAGEENGRKYTELRFGKDDLVRVQETPEEILALISRS